MALEQRSLLEDEAPRLEAAGAPGAGPQQRAAAHPDVAGYGSAHDELVDLDARLDRGRGADPQARSDDLAAHPTVDARRSVQQQDPVEDGARLDHGALGLRRRG